METSSELNQTQQYIFEILKETVRIFDRMGLTYYMQGGTMLGAVRHHGFIPWDDDVDLGMYRSDYERFLKEIENYLPENLELQTYWDESTHHYYFARIVDRRYQIKRMGSKETRYENVWVDIFPLDGMPDNAILCSIHKLRLSFARLCYHLSCIEKVNVKRPGRPLIERIVIRCATVVNVGKLLNTRKCLDKMDRLLKKYPVENSDWVVNFTGQTSFKFNELFRKGIYGSGAMYRFESIMLPGPEKYDEYLTSLYGDYMTPPKAEDRNSHVSELVKKE